MALTVKKAMDNFDENFEGVFAYLEETPLKDFSRETAYSILADATTRFNAFCEANKDHREDDEDEDDVRRLKKREKAPKTPADCKGLMEWMIQQKEEGAPWFNKV